MAPHRLSDNEIKTRVSPTRLRWPESGTTIAWTKLHDCVDALHGLARVVDGNCAAAEGDADLSPDGVARRRAVLGKQALGELASFKAFQAAEKAVLSDIDYLEKKMVDLPQLPSANFDVALAQELRSHIRGQKSPIDFVMKSLAEPRVLGAVLTVPAFLSGLSDAEYNLVRERARAALHPVQAEMQSKLAKALDELREGIAATQRMLVERCGIREDDEGQAQPIREPLPGGVRVAVA